MDFMEAGVARPTRGRELVVGREGVITPEEVLRRQMRQMGAEGERYDYVLFEGNARLLLPRHEPVWLTSMWPWAISQMIAFLEW